jgi:hypothetical protein
MGQAEPPCAVDLRAAAVGWRHLRQIRSAADRVCDPRLMESDFDCLGAGYEASVAAIYVRLLFLARMAIASSCACALALLGGASLTEHVAVVSDSLAVLGHVRLNLGPGVVAVHVCAGAILRLMALRCSSCFSPCRLRYPYDTHSARVSRLRGQTIRDLLTEPSSGCAAQLAMTTRKHGSRCLFKPQRQGMIH